MTAGWLFKLRGMMILAVLTLFVTPCLNADIYVYVDKQGVFHFTNVPTNDKYKVYLREKPQTPRSSHNPHQYDDVITEAARQHGLDFPLLKALIHVESYFDPRAVSRKGAMGLTQIMPGNLEFLKINDPFDPWENIMGGARYLKSMLERFDGQLVLALAAYNAGPSAVEQYNAIPPFKETREYVDKVIRFVHHYNAN